MKKLDNLTLNNLKDTRNSSDRYIVNEQSHTIYYQKGVLLDGKVYYTLPENYQKAWINNEYCFVFIHYFSPPFGY